MHVYIFYVYMHHIIILEVLLVYMHKKVLSKYLHIINYFQRAMS